MKKELSEIKVKRLGSSPYFKENFLNNEKIIIESIKGVTMLPFGSSDEADIAITNTHIEMNEKMLAELKNCKLIIHSNSGYDNYHLNFVKNFKAPIVLGNSIRKHAVANYNLSAIFNHFSNIPSHLEWDKNRKWPRKLLSELNIQIIGFGEIGQILFQSLSPLVKQIKIYDPDKNQNQLDFPNADILLLCAGLNPTSQHLINEKIFNQLKKSILIVNGARGELIETKSLIHFLKTNPESFAVLDVFEKEPNTFEDFKNIINIKTTSHIAGVYESIDQATFEFEKKCIEDFLTKTNFNEEYKNILLNNRLRDHYLL